MRHEVHHAIAYALKMHEGQTYGDEGLPMFVHLADVATIVTSLGGTKDEVVAAYLHDVIEDTAATKQSLRDAGFSELQIHLIDMCTDDSTLPDRATKKKAVNQRFVKEGRYNSALVKCSDRLANQGYTLMSNNKRMMKRYVQEFDEFYQCVAHHLTSTYHGRHAREMLCDQYQQMVNRLS